MCLQPMCIQWICVCMFIHVYIASTIHFTCYEKHRGMSAKCLDIKCICYSCSHCIQRHIYYVRGS